MKQKLYKIVKGVGGGANQNAIGIEITGKSMESALFVSKVRVKAEQLFGRGSAGNSIATTYGVHFKYEDIKKNKKMANMLIRIVQLEQELLSMKNNI